MYTGGAGPRRAGESCKFLNGMVTVSTTCTHNHHSTTMLLRGGAGAKLPSGGAKNSVLGVEYKN